MGDTEQDAREASFHSPRSFMSSSVQSNQMPSFDIEDRSITSRKISKNWRLGMPWFGGAPQSQSKDVTGGTAVPAGEARYYGGLMKPDAQLSKSNSNAAIGFKWHARPARGGGTSRQLARTAILEGDSIANFDDSEWTPPDSAYGAACPVCGCVPKRVRRMVEFSLIAGMVVGFVWILVATSIHVTNAHKNAVQSNSTDYHSNNPMSAVDDDYYLETTNGDDDAVQNSNFDDTYDANDAFDDDNTDDAAGQYDDAQNNAGR